MKKIAIGILIGILISGTVGVIAANTISSSVVTYNNKTVEKSLDELYDQAVTGKGLIATAITNKGVTTSNTATYQTMADNISNIDTDHSTINKKITDLESKHSSDVSSLTSSINTINQSLLNLKTVAVTVSNGNGIGTLDIKSYISNAKGCIPVIKNVTSLNWSQSVSVQGSLLIVAGPGVMSGYSTEVILYIFY